MSKYNGLNEQQLIALVKKDDHLAFKVLYDRFVPRLYSFIEYYFGSSVTANEYVQEAFIQIWEKRATLDENKNLNAYLIQIMKNKVFNAYRHNLYEQKYRHSRKLQPVYSDSTNEYILFNELEENIRKGIESLPPIQKEVFIMSREQGLSHEDIAMNLNISKRTVEQHIYKSLKHLKKVSYHYDLHILLLIIVKFLIK